jgi:hypothetical protein
MASEQDDSSKAKIFMASRREAAAIVFNDHKEMHRATFEVQAQWGRWLLASLLLIHGGALFGLFSFLSALANKPAALVQYQYTIWWFVSGILFTLCAGFVTWLNWSMHCANYESWAHKPMLWDPEEWVGDTIYSTGLDVTNWLAMIFGIVSALCIVGGAYSTLNGKWIPTVALSGLA